jgi:phage-related protein
MNRTETIVNAYINGMKATYVWAQRDDAIAEKGLAMGADAARNACAGKLKLDGACWMAALRSAGFTGNYTMAALKAFCEE